MIPRYSRPEMAALWGDEARFQLWLEVETVALAGLVEAGLAPKQALEDVKAKGVFNAERVLEIEAEVKHDVIAFLTNVAEHVGESARYLHLGMTSSDLLDTTLSIQLARAADMLLKGVDGLLEVLKKRADEAKQMVCIGRSHGIHAEPMTMGLKFAGFYAELLRQRARLEQARSDVAAGKVSGPVGTFAHLPPSVEEHVCKHFGLTPDPVSTQVISRDRHAAFFSALAQLAGTCDRMVTEVRHLQRTEVREVEEGFTKGQKGSSAMPHKKNPILSENVSGLVRIVRSAALSAFENVALWHERDISHSSVERVIAPDATIAMDFMLARVTSIFKNLVLYEENMQRNLELTHGLQFSGGLLVELAKKGLSREDAYKLVQGHAMKVWDELSSGGVSKDFEARIREDQEVKKLLSEEELSSVFSIERHTAHIDFIYKRVFQ